MQRHVRDIQPNVNSYLGPLDYLEIRDSFLKNKEDRQNLYKKKLYIYLHPLEHVALPCIQQHNCCSMLSNSFIKSSTLGIMNFML